MRDQAEKLRQMVQTSTPGSSSIIKQRAARARVIAITSGKGGVGKTNFTVNLALALAELEQRVLIIDADLGLANVDVVLGQTAPFNIMHLIEQRATVADIIVDGPRGIKYISGGSGIWRLAELNDQELAHFINQITLFDNWADIILIDTGAGLSRNVLNFVMAADEVFIITTPEPTAITDAYAMMKSYAGHHGRAPLRIVVNRVTESDEGQVVVDKLVKVAFRFLGVRINSLGFIYEDTNMVKAVKKQVPLLLSFPDSMSSQCIKHIAQRVLFGDNVAQPRGIKGFFQRFWEIMH